MTPRRDPRPDIGLRPDLKVVAEWVNPGARVLDVGCGEGALLAHLAATKAVDGRGIELSQEGVNACVSHGLAVIQGDADTDLGDYPDDAFDMVILSQTLQAIRDPRSALIEMLRIGRCAIVSFPNFGHWRARVELMLRGRVPAATVLGHAWYETPNIHPCTIRDFIALCRRLDIEILRAVALGEGGRASAIRGRGGLANLVGREAIFQLCNGRGAAP